LGTPTPSVAIFDSGVGGISVFRELFSLLPNARYHYFADNAFAPYGSKDVAEVVNRSFLISDFLLSKGVDIVVVACNTATSAAISKLRESFQIPFVGMEPAIKPAASTTQSGIIGVLATEGTLGGEKFINNVVTFASSVEVVQVSAKMLVPLIEKGIFEGEELEERIEEYLAPILERGADSVVLGCTHYPLIQKSIQKVAGGGVTLIDPSYAVAKQVIRVLQENLLLSTQENRVGAYAHFYCSGSCALLKESVARFLPALNNLSFQERVLI